MRNSDLIKEAKLAVGVAQAQEEWAINAFATAYRERLHRIEEGSAILYATKDGWDNGPLPFALELSDGSDVDSDDEAWAVFLYRDGGPTCGRFLIQEAEQAVSEGRTPALGALAFVRQITYPSGRIAFLDGHQAAGLLLAVLRKEERLAA